MVVKAAVFVIGDDEKRRFPQRLICPDCVVYIGYKLFAYATTPAGECWSFSPPRNPSKIPWLDEGICREICFRSLCS